MSKATLSSARMSYESAGVNLEQVICEHLEPYGAQGQDLQGNNVPATGDDGCNVTLTAVRYHEGALEGLTTGGDWVSISIFNEPGDYSVYIGFLCAMMEISIED